MLKLLQLLKHTRQRGKYTRLRNQLPRPLFVTFVGVALSVSPQKL